MTIRFPNTAHKELQSEVRQEFIAPQLLEAEFDPRFRCDGISNESLLLI
jgi:hypothetical protein